MRKSILGIIMLSFFLAAGCTHEVKLKQNISPTGAFMQDKLPLNVYLVIDDSVQKLRESVRPSGVTAAFDTFNFDVGKSLTPVLTQAVESAFTTVKVSDVVPSREGMRAANMHGIVIIKKASSDIDIEFQPGLMTQLAIAQYTLALNVAFLDRDGKTIFSSIAKNFDRSSKNVGMFSGGEKELGEAVDKTVQGVSGKVAETLLNSGPMIKYSQKIP